MIAIIDYDAGNLKSVEKALAHIGEESVITREFQTILKLFYRAWVHLVMPWRI